MTHTIHLLTGALSGLAVCLTCQAGDSAGAVRSPYQGIAERNPFQLAPAPPVSQPTVAKTPQPRIFLTGLTTLAGRCALLKATQPAGPGGPAQVKYYVIPEGGRQGDIQVLAIDEQAGTAKLNCAGTELTVNLKDKDPSAIAVAAPASGPVAASGAGPDPAEPAPAPISPAQFQPRIVPTAPPILSQSGSPANGPEPGRRYGYDEHGL